MMMWQLWNSQTNRKVRDLPSDTHSVVFHKDHALVFTAPDGCSVHFTVDGHVVRTENAAPFALAGNTPQGLNPWLLTIGTHTLSATVFSEQDAKGTVMQTTSLVLAISSGFTAWELWNTHTMKKHQNLIAPSDEIMYNPAHTILFQANASCSVEFFSNDQRVSVENQAPFTLATTLTPGTYALKAVVYNDKDANGTIVTVSAVILTVDTRNATPIPLSPVANPQQVVNDVYREEFHTHDIASLLKKHGYWVFADGVEHVRQYTSPAIPRRFVLNRGTLTITCFKEDADYTRTTLNPRAELRVEGYPLQENVAYSVTITHQIGAMNAGFEFLQIMNQKPAASPLLQLEVRKGQFGVRYWNFRDALLVVPLFPVHLRKVTWVVECLLHPSQGYFRVLCDGKEVWKRQGQTLVAGSKRQWIQYGVYKNAASATDQSMTVHTFAISKK
jgi:hypothetical protein